MTPAGSSIPARSCRWKHDMSRPLGDNLSGVVPDGHAQWQLRFANAL